MITYQDFLENKGDIPAFVRRAITAHLGSEAYRIAVSADNYDHQKNETIYNYVRTIFSSTGSEVVDFTAANNKIASNFFNRLNTQRTMYSLGNGVSFTENLETRLVDGEEITVDLTKEELNKGGDFDTDLRNAAYNALIHGVSFGYWNYDRLYVFPLTEFVPLWDEDTGALMAGIRFWQLADNKPMTAVLYEPDGYTKLKGKRKSGTMDFEIIEEKHAYIQRIQTSEAGGDEIIGAENYGSLPIVPLWGSRLHQSTLVGMQRAIDSYDLIRSGFANDLTDCAQIYWILSNCSGMTEPELARFRDRMKVQHIVVADTENSSVTPYTQEIPYNARQVFLDGIRSGIYEDFGGLDVHTIAAGDTNDHIDAAYQPLDENADDFEYQVSRFILQLLALIGIEDYPKYKRNRISNVKEQVEILMLEAPYLDEQTMLQKMPNITVDEIPGILARKKLEDTSRFEPEPEEEEEDELMTNG